MLPSIDSLRCFVAAAKLLRFRAAARSVGLTPAAFGQRIKQLEDQLGTELFRRTTRTVHLTEAGLALLPVAETCLDAAAECLRVVAPDARSAAPIDVTLGTRHELGLSWILPELEPLEASTPWLRVHLYFGSGPDLVLRVRTMEIDCAVTSSTLSDPKLDAIKLHREGYVFVGSRALLAKTPLRRPDHAADHVLLDSNAGLPLFRYFREASADGDRFRFGSVVGLGTIEAIRRRAVAGAGVAVLPEYLVEPDLAKGRLVRLFPRVKLQSDWFRLVFRGDDPRRAVYERIAAQLLKRPLR